MSIYEKLSHIQRDLKAPKNQYNSFGKYNYRSCEDIMEGLKPLLAREKCALTVSDELVNMGSHFYIKATATLHDCESDCTVTNTALARESEEKKGMDSSQVTGTASSYARKYALNGLFCIDDTKDADTDEYKNSQTRSKKTEPPSEYKCCVCGKPFTGFTGKDGKTYNEGQAYHISENMNSDGKARCGECMKKAGTRKGKSNAK